MPHLQEDIRDGAPHLRRIRASMTGSSMIRRSGGYPPPRISISFPAEEHRHGMLKIEMIKAHNPAESKTRSLVRPHSPIKISPSLLSTSTRTPKAVSSHSGVSSSAGAPSARIVPSFIR